jgi:hypothetical protein
MMAEQKTDENDQTGERESQKDPPHFLPLFCVPTVGHDFLR